MYALSLSFLTFLIVLAPRSTSVAAVRAPFRLARRQYCSACPLTCPPAITVTVTACAPPSGGTSLRSAQLQAADAASAWDELTGADSLNFAISSTGSVVDPMNTQLAPVVTDPIAPIFVSSTQAGGNAPASPAQTFGAMQPDTSHLPNAGQESLLPSNPAPGPSLDAPSNIASSVNQIHPTGDALPSPSGHGSDSSRTIPLPDRKQKGDDSDGTYQGGGNTDSIGGNNHPNAVFATSTDTCESTSISSTQALTTSLAQISDSSSQTQDAALDPPPSYQITSPQSDAGETTCTDSSTTLPPQMPASSLHSQQSDVEGSQSPLVTPSPHVLEGYVSYPHSAEPVPSQSANYKSSYVPGSQESDNAGSSTVQVTSYHPSVGSETTGTTMSMNQPESQSEKINKSTTRLTIATVPITCTQTVYVQEPSGSSPIIGAGQPPAMTYPLAPSESDADVTITVVVTTTLLPPVPTYSSSAHSSHDLSAQLYTAPSKLPVIPGYSGSGSGATHIVSASSYGTHRTPSSPPYPMTNSSTTTYMVSDTAYYLVTGGTTARTPASIYSASGGSVTMTISTAVSSLPGTGQINASQYHSSSGPESTALTTRSIVSATKTTPMPTGTDAYSAFTAAATAVLDAISSLSALPSSHISPLPTMFASVTIAGTSATDSECRASASTYTVPAVTAVVPVDFPWPTFVSVINFAQQIYDYNACYSSKHNDKSSASWTTRTMASTTKTTPMLAGTGAHDHYTSAATAVLEAISSESALPASGQSGLPTFLNDVTIAGTSATDPGCLASAETYVIPAVTATVPNSFPWPVFEEMANYGRQISAYNKCYASKSDDSSSSTHGTHSYTSTLTWSPTVTLYAAEAFPGVSQVVSTAGQTSYTGSVQSGVTVTAATDNYVSSAISWSFSATTTWKPSEVTVYISSTSGAASGVTWSTDGVLTTSIDNHIAVETNDDLVSTTLVKRDDKA